MKKIGFVGLGTMGTPMSKNLLKAGFGVYNRSAGKTKPLADLGAKVAASPAEAARQSEVVITMLAADQAVKEMILGPNGVAEGVSAGQIVIDSSTISPVTSRLVSAELAKKKVEVLDAPVTGSEPQAIAAQLTFIVGGNKAVFEKCQPLFKAMGKSAFHVGGSGAGSYAKLANNTIAAINLVAFAEGVTMATKAGIDPQVFVDIVSGGGARSGQIDGKAAKVFGRDFHPNFAAALMYKDLGLAGEVAKELNIPTPVLAVVRELLNMTIAKGFGQEDMCAVVKCYEEWAGIQVKK